MTQTNAQNNKNETRSPFDYEGIYIKNINELPYEFFKTRDNTKLNPFISSGNGYYMITGQGQIQKPILVHSLVMNCFGVVKQNEKLVVDHIDGNRLNNSIDNLQYITQSENIKKAHKKPIKREFITLTDDHINQYCFKVFPDNEKYIFDVFNFVLLKKNTYQNTFRKIRVAETRFTLNKYNLTVSDITKNNKYNEIVHANDSHLMGTDLKTLEHIITKHFKNIDDQYEDINKKNELLTLIGSNNTKEIRKLSTDKQLPKLVDIVDEINFEIMDYIKLANPDYHNSLSITSYRFINVVLATKILSKSKLFTAVSVANGVNVIKVQSDKTVTENLLPNLVVLSRHINKVSNKKECELRIRSLVTLFFGNFRACSDMTKLLTTL